MDVVDPLLQSRPQGPDKAGLSHHHPPWLPHPAPAGDWCIVKIIGIKGRRGWSAISFWERRHHEEWLTKAQQARMTCMRMSVCLCSVCMCGCVWVREGEGERPWVCLSDVNLALGPRVWLRVGMGSGKCLMRRAAWCLTRPPRLHVWTDVRMGRDPPGAVKRRCAGREFEWTRQRMWHHARHEDQFPHRRCIRQSLRVRATRRCGG